MTGREKQGPLGSKKGERSRGAEEAKTSSSRAAHSPVSRDGERQLLLGTGASHPPSISVCSYFPSPHSPVQGAGGKRVWVATAAGAGHLGSRHALLPLPSGAGAVLMVSWWEEGDRPFPCPWASAGEGRDLPPMNADIICCECLLLRDASTSLREAGELCEHSLAHSLTCS